MSLIPEMKLQGCQVAHRRSSRSRSHMGWHLRYGISQLDRKTSNVIVHLGHLGRRHRLILLAYLISSASTASYASLSACWRPLFPILTVNFSGINWALHYVSYIFYLILTNSTSFSGLRCFAELCSEYARNSTKWRIYKDGEKFLTMVRIIHLEWLDSTIGES